MAAPDGRDRLSRRGFLKGLAGALGAGALTLVSGKPAAASGPVSKGEVFGVLVDLTRCISCRACSRACVKANDLEPADTGSDVSPSHLERLAHDKWSIVNTVPGASKPVGVKRQCMHCLEPACVSVCPVGALHQTELGPVIYRADRCIGCRYCMMTCPFEVPRFDWHSGFTPVIGKCQFCAQQRLFKGLAPACADACPTGALKFGKRQALLFEAKARVRANPGKYVDHVYGENEIGGTSWLYLSAVPFERLGFKTHLPDSPIPSYTGEVISRLPVVVAALVGLLGTVAFTLEKDGGGEDHAP